MIFVNFKVFEEGTGDRAVELVRIIEEVAVSSQIKIIPAVQAADIKEVVSVTRLEVWSQKIDAVEPGPHTGAVLAEAVYEDGAAGTFLNHSENKFDNFENLSYAVERANRVGLKTLIFAATIDELSKVLSLKPTYLSYEPPELIGSTSSSVAQAQPEIISKAAEICKKAGIPLIVGAGVHSAQDVKKSLELGAVGVAVATDIVKAQDPRFELQDLTEGFK